ncbi:hypothetical protein CSB20_03590 [bacterium DOLZORAL124_64_63]|nr:MAG: hypothetical protein CSB20_03590 [bacterium DOLZORAL124_64_63]
MGADPLKNPFLCLLGALVLILAPGGPAPADDDCEQPPARLDVYTNVGLLGLNVTNLGYVGTSFDTRIPSGEYPLHSNVEHVYSGGLWVGAVMADGQKRVSTGSQDANGIGEGNETREFDLIGMCQEDAMRIISNSQNFDNFSLDALATQHIECNFNDYANPEGGGHVPLGLKVNLRALAWSNPYADDFVILDYRIINISNEELRDIYLGMWFDNTVGNTEQTDPYDPQAPVGWNFYDDYDGAFGAQGWVPEEHTVPDDPDIWMTYEYDDDGEGGLATSWIGTRLLGTSEEPQPEAGVRPVSYNLWGFRHVPLNDDEYEDDENPDEMLPGKYQLMGNGQFDVGVTENGDFSFASNWISLLSTGPFPRLAPNDTLGITFAVVAGADSLSLLANSKIAQVAFDDGFSIPSGPPSPRLEFGFAEDGVVISWAPGDSLDADGNVLGGEDPRRSPEHHISNATGQEDFQGYRIFRYQGLNISEDPYQLAEMVAQFDIVDGIGFDTGLPPLNAEGKRQFVDTDLLDGFPYWYSVVSYSAPNELESLPEFQSGFNENSRLVYPGPSPSGDGHGQGVGVFPNPYRAASLFDARAGELEIGRKIWFTRLPARCKIQIFTLGGEVVRTIHHEDQELGMASWDTLTDHGRATATGLYIYAVTDLDTDEVQRGKLVIIK